MFDPGTPEPPYVVSALNQPFNPDAESIAVPGAAIQTPATPDDVIDKSKMVPGFTMSLRTRPLTIAKLDAYVKEQSIQIQSRRTLDELRTLFGKMGDQKPKLDIMTT